MLDVTVKATLPELTPFTGQNLLLLHAMKSQLFFPQSAIYCSFLPTLAHSVLTVYSMYSTHNNQVVSLVQKAYCSFQKSGELGVEQAKMFKDATPFGR